MRRKVTATRPISENHQVNVADNLSNKALQDQLKKHPNIVSIKQLSNKIYIVPLSSAAQWNLRSPSACTKTTRSINLSLRLLYPSEPFGSLVILVIWRSPSNPTLVPCTRDEIQIDLSRRQVSLCKTLRMSNLRDTGNKQCRSNIQRSPVGNTIFTSLHSKVCMVLRSRITSAGAAKETHFL